MNTALGELSLLSNLKYQQMMLKDPPSYCVELYHRDNCFYVSEKLKLQVIPMQEVLFETGWGDGDEWRIRIEQYCLTFSTFSR